MSGRDLLADEPPSAGRDLLAGEPAREPEPRKEKTFLQSLMPPTREEVQRSIRERFAGQVAPERLEFYSERAGRRFAPEQTTPSDPTEAIGRSAVFGAGAGAAAPEITKGIGRGSAALGSLLQMAPFAPVRAAGTGLQTFGRGMEAASPTVGRVVPSLLGAIGGVTGESAGQLAEAAQAPPVVAEAARIGGGMIPSVAPTITAATVKKFVGLPPGISVADVTKQLLKERGVNISDLSKAEKDQIEALMSNLRSGRPKGFSEEELYERIVKSVGEIEQRAAKRVSAMERGATRLTAGAERREEAARAGIQTIGTAERTATDIGQNARQLVVARQAALEAERGTPYAAARDAVYNRANEREAAGQYIEGTEAYKKLTDKLMAMTLTGQEGLKQRVASETEKGVVSAYRDVLDAIQNRRAVIGTSKNPAEQALAQNLERQGLRVIKKEQDGVITYIREFPTGFQALDTLRRRLGQSAKFGEEVSGYQALGANNAAKLYSEISDIQAEFVGKDLFRKMQSIYETGTERLAPFGAKAGSAYTRLDLSNPERFAKDPSALVREMTKSSTAFDDFVALSNNAPEARRLASDWAAGELANKNAKQAEQWIAKNKDVLSNPNLADLRSRLTSYVSNLKTSEAAAERGRGGAKALQQRAAQTDADAQKMKDQIVGSDFPVPTIKNLILKGDKETWERVGPLLAQDLRSKFALLDAVKDTLSTMPPDKAASVFRDRIAYALPNAGIPSFKISELQQRLDNIASYKIPEPEKLTMTQNLLSQFFRQYIIPKYGPSEPSIAAQSAIRSIAQPTE